MAIAVSTAPRPNPCYTDCRSFPRKVCIHCYAPVDVIDVEGEGLVVTESGTACQASFINRLILETSPRHDEPVKGRRLNIEEPWGARRDHRCRNGKPAEGYIIEHGGHEERVEL